MISHPIPANRVPVLWPYLEPLITLAIDRSRQDVSKPELVAETRERLLSGQYELALVRVPGASGIVVSELCVIDGVRVCWLPFVAGRTGMPPRAFIRFMRSAMVRYEDMAKQAGAEEIRICGRDWSRVFPGFVRHDGMPNELRKKL